MNALGIDIGGSRIKAALVDLGLGKTATKRQRIDTPQPATPGAIVEACAEVASPFVDASPVGVGFPGVVRDGIVYTAQNLHPDWIGFHLEEALSDRMGRPVTVLNDADAAGVAEIRFGKGKAVSGSVILLTVGTGLGSALFVDGQLVPNTEFGRMFFGSDKEAEARLAEPAKQRDGLTEVEWARRFEEFLQHLEGVFYPEMIIVGGGGAKHFPQVQEQIQTSCALEHAEAKNKAGIIGAALWAHECRK